MTNLSKKCTECESGIYLALTQLVDCYLQGQHRCFCKFMLLNALETKCSCWVLLLQWPDLISSVNPTGSVPSQRGDSALIQWTPTGAPSWTQSVSISSLTPLTTSSVSYLRIVQLIGKPRMSSDYIISYLISLFSLSVSLALPQKPSVFKCFCNLNTYERLNRCL